MLEPTEAPNVIDWKFGIVVFLGLLVFSILFLYDPISNNYIARDLWHFAWNQSCSIDPATGKQLQEVQDDTYLNAMKEVSKNEKIEAAQFGITDIADVTVPPRYDYCQHLEGIRTAAKWAFTKRQMDTVSDAIISSLDGDTQWGHAVGRQYLLQNEAIFATMKASMDGSGVSAAQIEKAKSFLKTGEWQNAIDVLDSEPNSTYNS